MVSKIRPNYKKLFYRIFLCLLGSFVLAFGNAVFLTPAKIDAGGVTGIGIIVNYFVNKTHPDLYVVDVVVLGLNILFFILAVIFLNKRFVIQTLIATFAVPLFMSLIHYTGMFSFISNLFVDLQDARLLLAGMFGGLFVGLGCTITFFGDGSTGGVDVLSFIMHKYFSVKQSLTSFIWDSAVIIIGLALMRDNVFATLVGALSILLSALVIDFLYVQSTSNYIADIITDKYEELNGYILKELDRTSTIIEVVGGYTKSKRKMIRFVVEKHEFAALKDQISIIDPKAFVTVYRAKSVLGEGFSNISSRRFKFLSFRRKKKIENKKNDK